MKGGWVAKRSEFADVRKGFCRRLSAVWRRVVVKVLRGEGGFVEVANKKGHSTVEKKKDFQK